jgi:metal-responsive CopG/Arc/MetJ family transcriptional regulator
MTTITCKLPDGLDAKLEALAQKRGVSKSEVVREALERTLQETSKRLKPSAYDLMKDCCGIVKGGPSDYATNPKYLEDLGK